MMPLGKSVVYCRYDHALCSFGVVGLMCFGCFSLFTPGGFLNISSHCVALFFCVPLFVGVGVGGLGDGWAVACVLPDLLSGGVGAMSTVLIRHTVGLPPEYFEERYD